jgi:hypothetical protein
MTDFVEKTVLVKDYHTIQMQSFAYLHTTPADWEVCPIIAVSEGAILFDIPAGYQLTFAYSQMYPITDLIREKIRHNIINGLCELCGHEIKYLWPIKCDSKKIYMYVGSECVNNFKGANYTVKKIREYKETMVTKVFKAWRGIAITQAYSDEQFFERDMYGKTYTIRGRPALRYKVWKFVDKLERMYDSNILTQQEKERIVYPFTITKKDINTISPRKIINIFKKAKELGFIIPNEIETQFLTKTKTEKEAKS